MNSRPISVVLFALQNMTGRKPVRTGSGWKAHCPAHDDEHPSLTVAEADDGRALVHCFAGCTAEAVVSALGLTLRDLMPPDNGIRLKAGKRARNSRKRSYATARDAVAELERRLGPRSADWTYTDALEQPVGLVLRWDSPDGCKTIRPIARDGDRWRIGGMSAPRPLYRLPELEAAERVYIVEGEKAAEAARSIGLAATTSAQGSRSANKSDWSPLAGRECIILPDNDDAGRQYAKMVVGNLAKLNPTPTTRIVDLPDLPEYGDIVEYIDARRAAGLSDAAIAAEINGLGDQAEAVETEHHDLPSVLLPDGPIRISDSAARLGVLLAATGRFYNRGRAVVSLRRDGERPPVLSVLKPASMPAAFESVAKLEQVSREGNFEPAVCSEQNARLIMHSEPFLNALPPICVVTRCPVLIEQGGKLLQVTTYERESGILAGGLAAHDVSLDEARELLNDLLRDFQFATPSDRSRALAAIITPALILGGLLHERAPVDMGDANASQTGKGFRNKLTAAIYRDKVTTVAQRKGGVGSIEEAFDAALIAGKTFISFDNIRGKLDSPAVESFLTEDQYSARMPYSPPIGIDPSRTVVMMTSNRAEITTDLANRSSIVRLVKQPPGYEFRRYEEGDLLDHVRENWLLYLGAVFAVVRAWHAAGSPRSAECRHDFRAWAQTLDWIVQELFGAAALIEGYAEVKRRTTDSALTRLRSVALAVVRAGRTDEPLRTHELLDIIDNEPDIDIPGVEPGAGAGGDPDDDVRERALRAMGRQLGKCFARARVIRIDGILVERQQTWDEAGRRRYEYTFTEPDFPRSPASMPTPSRIIPPISRIPRGDSNTEIGADGRPGDETCDNKSSATSAGYAGKRGIHAGNAGDGADGGDTGDAEATAEATGQQGEADDWGEI